MNKATLAALKGSIEKWEGIVAGTAGDRGGDNCPLCEKFWRSRNEARQCAGCPVMIATGQPHCFDTPYYSFRSASKYDTELKAQMAVGSTAKRRAVDMLTFLQSLLPEPKKPPAKQPAPKKRATPRNKESA